MMTVAHATAVGHSVAAQSRITFFQAVVLGLLQGVSELFPVSSLGHAVVFPALFNWHNLVASESKPESFWLAFVVALHVGTALALVAFFWKDWKAIIAGLFHSLRTRTVTTGDRAARLAPRCRDDPGRYHWPSPSSTNCAVSFSRPLAASIFLVVNGFILFGGEAARRRAEIRERRGHLPPRELKTLEYREAGVIGTAQVLARLVGISRSGITMVAGLIRGLDYKDAARFSFLLATPVILLAGLYKIPDLMGLARQRRPRPGTCRRRVRLRRCFVLGLVPDVCTSGRCTLWPFGLYCLVFGTFCIVRFA